MMEAFTGIFVFSGLLSLMAFVFLKDKSYLFYGLYVLATGIYLSQHSHIHPMILSVYGEHIADRIDLTLHIPLLMTSYTFYYLFVRSMLTQSNDVGSFLSHYLMRGAQGILIMGIVSAVLVWIAPKWYYRLAFPFLIVVIVVSLIGLYLIFAHGSSLARVLILGTTLYLLGSILGFLDYYFGFLSALDLPSDHTLWTTVGGFLMEMVVFSFALVYRSRQKERLRFDTLRKSELYDFQKELYTQLEHEIRTPLTLIRSMSEQIENNDLRSRLHKQSLRIVDLVGQLTKAFDVPTGSPQYEAGIVHLYSFCTDIVDAHRWMAKKVDIHIAMDYGLDEDLSVETDADKLHSILANLLSNAIKYSPPKTTIDVTVSAATPDTLELSVSDQGQGIDDADLPHVYEPHYRGAKTKTSKVKGQGLGLSIVKSYVEVLGGVIDVQSTKGVGSTFRVLLPLKIAHDLEVKEDAQEQKLAVASRPVDKDRQDTRKYILLAEDNLELAAFVEQIFDPKLYIVKTELNGQSALHRAIREVPDLVITDIMMPVMDGITLCQELKDHEMTTHIPVIMLTAKATDTAKIEGLKSGANAYIIKPFDNQELLLVTKNVLHDRDKLRMKFSHIAGPKPKKIIPDPFVDRMLQTIADNCADPELNVDKLATLLFITKTQLYRKVKSTFDDTPLQLIHAKRVEEACRLLSEEPEMSISEVAQHSGFVQVSHFSRIFKKHTQQSPLQYRKTKA